MVDIVQANIYYWLNNIIMNLISIELLEQLKIGDILHRFPSNGKPEKIFDETRKEDISTYKIRFINKQEGIFRLAIDEESLIMFVWPGDIEYLDIRRSSILSEAVWWIG